MADHASEIEAAGAEIVWVLEEDTDGQPGTAARCMDLMDNAGAPEVGWCVGDAQTWPEKGTFDRSPFAEGRGFDLIVPRSTMAVAWTSSHGSPSGNDNADGAEILAAVETIVQGLR